MTDWLTDAEQLQRSRVPLADHAPQPRMLGTLETGISLEKTCGGGSRAQVELLVAQGIRNAKRRHTTLTLAEEITHPAKTEILAGDLETVVRAHEHIEPSRRLGTHIAQENAKRLLGAAADPASQLMELREAEALRM